MNHADLPVLNSAQAIQAAIDRDPELKARQVDQLNDAFAVAHPGRKSLGRFKEDLLRTQYSFTLLRVDTVLLASYVIFQVGHHPFI
jgi:hypothetical protein